MGPGSLIWGIPVIALGFPVFSRGVRPQDYGGRTDLADFDVTISCGDVTVHPGDLVFGDYDGVVVIPAEVEDEVIHKALEIVEEEEAIRRDLLQGGLISEVFRKHGVL